MEYVILEYNNNPKEEETYESITKHKIFTDESTAVGYAQMHCIYGKIEVYEGTEFSDYYVLDVTDEMPQPVAELEW